MKSDESFERTVRASLLASAAEQAPDGLVARIGEIPARQPSPTAGRGGLRLVARVAVNLAAAAVVVIAVAALSDRMASARASRRANPLFGSGLDSSGSRATCTGIRRRERRRSRHALTTIRPNHASNFAGSRSSPRWRQAVSAASCVASSASARLPIIKVAYR